MRIIRVIFFILLALILVLGTGLFIFVETFDTDQYLPQITNKVSSVLGRPVSIGYLGLGLSSHGITLDAGPVTIADDPGFTQQPFVTIDKIRVSLDIRSLIFQRKIYITHILLQSPQIHFIRSEDGRINVWSIGQENQSVVKTPGGEAILSVIASEAKQSFKSHQKIPSLPLASVEGIQIQDAAISFIDQSQGMPLDIWLTGINANIGSFSPSKSFRVAFDASLYSKIPNVHGSTMVSCDLSKKSIELSDAKLNVDLSQPDLNLLKGVSPSIPDVSIFKNMEGIMQLNLAHLASGASGGPAANGDITITGIVIKNFNIIKTVLAHALGSFGGLDGFIDKLGADDTVIKKAQAQFLVHDKSVFIDDSSIETNILELTVKGSMDQGLNVDMQTMLQLNTDVSVKLVNELDGLKYLMDDSKRITIEASLTGVISHLKFKPSKDFRKKTKRIFMAEGGNILGILLGSGQTSIQLQGSPSQDSGKKTKKSFKNILKSLLQ